MKGAQYYSSTTNNNIRDILLELVPMAGKWRILWTGITSVWNWLTSNYLLMVYTTKHSIVRTQAMGQQIVGILYPARKLPLTSRR